MKKIGSILILASLVFGLSNCNSGESINTDEPELPVADENSGEYFAYDDFMAGVDMNDTLAIGNSLYYIKESGESIEVEIFINEEGESVKLIERYTALGSYSVQKKIFYMKDGKKYVTRELYEDSVDMEPKYIERLSYYDENEKPILSQRKLANYEEELELESFEVIDNYDCSMDRTVRVLNQTDEFATTFQGFVQEEGTRYMIVGPNTKEGYTSTLLVQFFDQTINNLYNNEAKMVGKPLRLNFEKRDDGRGFEYQLLLGVDVE